MSTHVLVALRPGEEALRLELLRRLDADEVPTHAGLSRDRGYMVWRWLIRGRDAAATRARARAHFWTQAHWQLLLFERQGLLPTYAAVLDLVERSRHNARAAFTRRFELSVEGTEYEGFRADLQLPEADVGLGRCGRCQRGLRTDYVRRSGQVCAGCRLPASACGCTKHPAALKATGRV